MKILHLCPTFGNPTCGIARYSERLYSGIKAKYEDVAQQVYVGPLDQVHSTILQRFPDLVHLQLEYGFCSPERLDLIGEYCYKYKLPFLITYHSLAPVPHNIAADYPTTHRLTHAPDPVWRNYLQKAIEVNSPIPKLTPTYTRNIEISRWWSPYLFFGQAHYHKNLLPLIRWFGNNTNRELVVVASKGIGTNNTYWQTCRDLAEQLSNVLWIDEYLEESDVLGLAERCQAVILPYQEYGTVGVSAAIKLFLNLDVPILATKSSHFCDIWDRGAVEFSSTMEELLKMDLSTCDISKRGEYRETFSEENFVKMHYEIYKLCH